MKFSEIEKIVAVDCNPMHPVGRVSVWVILKDGCKYLLFPESEFFNASDGSINTTQILRYVRKSSAFGFDFSYDRVPDACFIRDMSPKLVTKPEDVLSLMPEINEYLDWD